MVANLYQYELPFEIPEMPLRRGLILQWNEGWGEIAPLPGWSRETFEEARSEILHWLPHLETATPFYPSVRFGISCASVPFSREPFECPIAGLNPSAKAAAQFPAIKLKVGKLLPFQAVELIKPFLGRSSLRIDCNRSWTLTQALSFASHFKPSDFEYLEEPVQNFEDLVEFSKITGFPIGVDESVSSFPIQTIPTLKKAVIKPTILGKIPENLPVDLVFSSSYETGLALLHIARLAKKYPFHPPGLDTYRFFKRDLLLSPLQIESGFLRWIPTPSYPPIDVSSLCLIATVP